MRLQIVWFKRDLRMTDHAPLAQAAARGPVVPLYIVEPAMLAAPDYAPAHWSFVRESLLALREALATLGSPLIVRIGDAVEILQQLVALYPVAAIWAHEETGNLWSYGRDRAVRRWARASGIPLHELPQGGVVRRLASRDQWEELWEARMAAPLVPAPQALRPPVPALHPGPIPHHHELGLAPDQLIERQPGGAAAAHQLLDDFLRRRGSRYPQALSSPLSAWEGCSRLSPHLAWGTLGIREAVWATRTRRAALESRPEGISWPWARALDAFAARLRWHCHFIQKLEDDPLIEQRSLVRAYDELRPDDPTDPHLAAWAAGQTGYPFVDACMRALTATGWLNFRMRAMLVSFACFDLWQHWRAPGLILARRWLDYEPGIHYSQLQMQSGTSGNRTLRIYNPIKQGQEHDPEGQFIRRWVPELAGVPGAYVHTPWLLGATEQIRSGCRIGHTYPAPLVEHTKAAQRARAAIAVVRANPTAQAEAVRAVQQHGSRRPPPPRRSRTGPAPGQLRLDLDI